MILASGLCYITKFVKYSLSTTEYSVALECMRQTSFLNDLEVDTSTKLMISTNDSLSCILLEILIYCRKVTFGRTNFRPFYSSIFYTVIITV